MTRCKHWTMRLIVVATFVLSLVARIRGESKCDSSEVRCLCGVPPCIDLTLVNNGVQDCQDGSDEPGQWDLSKCKTNGTTRSKRASISELLRVTNLGATTTFFEGGRGRTRPVGVLTTTMGSFQVSGTTTEYITKLLATYIKGTYARILTTTSRIYNVIPTTVNEIRPTGFITSAVSTEINGYATTVHTTEFYRTYIDNTYAQQMSAHSNIYYPTWYTEPIQPTYVVTASKPEEVDDGKIYPTPVYIPIDDLMTLDSTPPMIKHVNNGRFGRILVNAFQETSSEVSPTEDAPLALFVPPPQLPLQANQLEVVGTYGSIVVNDDLTYNVFTGTHVLGSQTFLFFFGNTALNPSLPGSPMENQQTIVVENGIQRDRLLVDVRDQLKLIVPGTKDRTTIDTTLDGQAVEGVMVEIEASESMDLITVEGARPEVPTPYDPRISTVTVTLDRNIAVPKISREKVYMRPVQPVPPAEIRPSPVPFPAENEILIGRSVPVYPVKGNPKAEPQIKPSKASFQIQNLPTYTVGAGNASPRNYYEATTNSAEDLTPDTESSTTATSKLDSVSKFRQPVFSKPSPSQSTTTLNPFWRKAKSFSDLRDLGSTGLSSTGWESNDLMSAASNRHATVTYVGFADFTTTVGNTVIVFMPRTRMLEDLSLQASATQTARVDPTRYTYHTSTEAEEEVTTPKRLIEAELILTTPKRPTELELPVTTPSPKRRIETEVPGTTPSPKRRVETEIPATTPSPRRRIETEVPATTPMQPTEVELVLTTPMQPTEVELLLTTPMRPTEVELVLTTPDRPTEVELILTTPKQPEPVTEPEIIEITTPKPPPVLIRPKFTKKKTESSTVVLPLETTILLSGRQTVFSQIKSTPTVTPVSKVFPVSPLFPKPVSKVASTETMKKLETAVFQKDRVNPTGLVSSITGSFVRDSTTTLVTSLVIGTYIEGSYAQVIKSTSTVFIQPASPTVEQTPIFIRPTPVPPQPSSSTFPVTSQPPTFSFSYEVTTSNPEEVETTTFERAEVSITSSTTEKEPETEPPTTTEETTTASLPINPQKQDLDEALNEIDRARKVVGRSQDQIILDDKRLKLDTAVEKPFIEKKPVLGDEQPPTTTPAADSTTTEAEQEEVDQTVYITKTVPTTVFRTYTYFTTYFIPKQDITVSSVISREVTSTAVGFVKKTFSSILPTSTVETTPEPSAVPTPSSYEDEEDEDFEPTYYKTYFTTFTYLTTFFTGETSSVSSREEIISSVSTITQLPAPDASQSKLPVRPTLSAVELRKQGESKRDVMRKESTVPTAPTVVEQTVFKTFFTTYTYFSTLFNGADASTRSRIEVITNVVPTIMRKTVSPLIEPSQTESSPPSSAASHSLDDLTEGGSNVSETSEATAPPAQEPGSDYYELESSEMTTDRSVYNEQELEDNGGAEATPALKTLFTTFSFFTTYYKGGTSSVATRLQTITNVVSDGTEADEATDAEQFPVFPITYLTTFTYWTTHFKGDSTVVSSREETISNVVTPGVDDVTATSTTTEIKPTEVPQPREPKLVELDGQGDAGSDEELDLTTYFTTYTYFTSSYIGDETIVNSRLETVTNVVGGTPPASLTSSSTATLENQARALTATSSEPELETEPVNLPVGLLSTVTNREVVDQTTTEYLTDIYGTYIDGIYAQVLESTSRIIQPSNLASTKFILEATESPTGLLAVNQGKTIEGDGQAITYYQTVTIGSIVEGTYAQIISSSSSVTGDQSMTDAHALGDAELQRTGLVRVIDGSLVQGDKTTFYTSSIYGTIIDSQYGQIIESTTRYVISPTQPFVLPTVEPTLTSSEPILTSSEPTLTSSEATSLDKEEEPTTTEVSEVNPLKKLQGLPGRARDRTRVPYTVPASKSLQPIITPFVSRSRPAFTPKRKEATAAVIVSREEVTPTVTATLAPTSSRSLVGSRPRFRRPGQDEGVTTTSSVEPTPKLPIVPGRSRFQRPSSSPAPVSSVSPSSSARYTPRPSVAPIKLSNSPSSSRTPPSKFSLRPRPSLSPSRPGAASGSTTVVQVTTTPPSTSEPEVTHEEEPETTEPPSKSTTTATRFGNNRFRLNPKLNVALLLSTTTTEKPTPPPRTRKTFTRPPLVSKATTAAGIEEETPPEEEALSDPPAVTTTTAGPVTKPSLKSFLSNRKLTSSPSRITPPSSNPRPNNRLTTTPPPTSRTTTRRAFAPRSRPQGFPSRALVRGSSSTEKSEEVEYENASKLEIPQDSALRSDSLGIEDEAGPDLVDSGSEFFETVRMSPYESYELYSDELPRSEAVFRPRLKRQVEHASRSRADILKNFRRGGREAILTKSKYPFPSSDTDRASSSTDKLDEYYYYDDELPPTTTTPKPKPTNLRSTSRFRGRIAPSAASSSRPTPFTLLPPTTPKSIRSPQSLLSSRRTHSRYSGPTRPDYTTTSLPKTTSRFLANRNSRFTTTSKPRSRFAPAMRNHRYEEPLYEQPTEEKLRTILTVTHFLPSETTISIVNGKATEFKTLLIPSPSVEILSPYQYTYSVENGQEFRILNSQVTSTPSIGFGGEVTKFIIKEVPTTTITFTPTTIRGRKTSFSHVISTHYYTIDPTVTSIGIGMLTNNAADPNQLTNLLLSQLLGSLNLAGLQRPQVQLQNGEPQTQYNTKTTTYVTTITDFTSTVIPITLHGKAIKTTVIESQVNVLTATELITESTVITAASTQAPPPALPALNPSLLQGLLQLQQQQRINQNFKIESTSVEILPPPSASRSTPTVVTLFVSGRYPGEYSTLLTTIHNDGSGSRRKREIAPSVVTRSEVVPTAALDLGSPPQIQLDDGYSYSEGTWITQSTFQDSFPIRTQSLETNS